MRTDSEPSADDDADGEERHFLLRDISMYMRARRAHPDEHSECPTVMFNSKRDKRKKRAEVIFRSEWGLEEEDSGPLPDPADPDVKPEFDILFGDGLKIFTGRANQKRLDHYFPKKKNRSKKWSRKKVGGDKYGEGQRRYKTIARLL